MQNKGVEVKRGQKGVKKGSKGVKKRQIVAGKICACMGAAIHPPGGPLA